MKVNPDAKGIMSKSSIALGEISGNALGGEQYWIISIHIQHDSTNLPLLGGKLCTRIYVMELPKESGIPTDSC